MIPRGEGPELASRAKEREIEIERKTERKREGEFFGQNETEEPIACNRLLRERTTLSRNSKIKPSSSGFFSRLFLKC